MIHSCGKAEEHLLGADIERGWKLQCAVPGGSWFGACPERGSSYSLVGCTVAPGFDFADFEMAVAADLKKEFPAHKDLISEFTAA